MMKHTPGPWFINGHERYTKYVEARIGGGWVQEVAACGPTENPEQQEANARLCAAAPELLEACQAFKRLYGRLWDVVEPSGSGFLSPESVKEYDAIHELMTAAIAKATD
ncbi:hypothetical protein [Pseudomonas aeruginosa]|uniref:hypothetical protein n=1 Tax=Pseudomonas aeruginosa TaxID=287 RepID=UPI001BCA6147|nr:hypothetical protein [Pseudomonas aeruginosa]HEJ1718327.1 hypothetical protein [Pseudomonas aeruginosa]HEJ5404744.1 hypothetical protein [Pseudomonas aeruginosa]HEJ5820800.1 hypothetical protein [Pseudomonas aeruginosa]